VKCRRRKAIIIDDDLNRLVIYYSPRYMLPVGGRQVAGPLHSIKSIGISVIHFETLIAYFFCWSS